MKKLVSAGILCAALLCGCGAQQQADGSAEYQLKISSLPQAAQIQTEQYTREAAAYQGTLRASEHYEMLLPYRQMIVQKDGSAAARYALADKNGEIVTDAVYDDVDVKYAGKNSVYILKQGKKFTCAAMDGSWVIGPFYGSIEVTENGIVTQERTKQGGWKYSHLFGFDGEPVFKTQDEILFCRDETLLCRMNGKKNRYLWCKTDGTPITEFEAQEVGAPEDGYVIAKGTNGYGVLDQDGVWAVEPIYQSLSGRCGRYLAAQKEGAFGILEIGAEKPVKEFEYTKIQLCDSTNPLYQLWSDEESIVVNAANGKRYAVPSEITSEEIVGLRQSGHTVQTDKGTVVFDDIVSFEIKGASSLYEIGKNTVAVQSDHELRLIRLGDSYKSEALPYVYCEPEITEALKNGDFTVMDPKTGRQGILSASGKLVLEPVYHEANVIADGYYQVQTAQFTGVVDKSGKWIVKLRSAAAD